MVYHSAPVALPGTLRTLDAIVKGRDPTSGGVPGKSVELHTRSRNRSRHYQMVPNGSYPLKSAARRSLLPGDLRWTMRHASPPDSVDVEAWLTFLQSSPWSLAHGDDVVFAGIELVWTYVLGWVSYLRGYSAAGGRSMGNEGAGRFTVGHATFTKVFEHFKEALSEYGARYEYPGWAPCTKYALVNSRSLYLAYLIRNEDQDLLLPLLRLVTRMVRRPHSIPFAEVEVSFSGKRAS